MMITVPDHSPAISQIESCLLNTSVYHIISAQCSYFKFSAASGFQMIVQLGSGYKIRKLYVNHTVNCHTSVTIEVEESGLYLVSIIPIIQGTGIINATVEYRETVVVGNTTTTIKFTGTAIIMAMN